MKTAGGQSFEEALRSLVDSWRALGKESREGSARWSGVAERRRLETSVRRLMADHPMEVAALLLGGAAGNDNTGSGKR